MVLTSFRCKFDKRIPKEVVYRDYKNFEPGIFREELKVVIHDTSEWGTFESRFLNTLDKHAPLKKKTIRANHAPYMTKTLKSAIMKRTQLANKYHNTRRDIDYSNFRRQKNYVDRLYKKEKKSFVNNLSMGDLTDNKKFWNTFNKLFSDKSKSNHKITLVKGNEILTNTQEVANEFSLKFSNAVKELNIPDIPTIEVSNQYDIVDTAILKYQNHPSVLKIIEKTPILLEEFEFHAVDEETVLRKLKELDTSKSTTFKNLPGKILKDFADTIGNKMTSIINKNLVEDHTFPDTLKYADAYPGFKKIDRTIADYYRPVSCLAYASKVFERIMHDQIN